VAAVAGALAAALSTMVARLTVGKAKYAEHEAAMRDAEARGEALRQELLELADADTRAYDQFVKARALSRQTPEEVRTRAGAMAEAAREVAAHGNTNAVSDAGVAAWLARSGAEGGALNVRINLGEVPEAERAPLEERVQQALERAAELHAECVKQVARRMAAAA
jgi:formiminotetrahydrofolate cyclodeaminase